MGNQNSQGRGDPNSVAVSYTVRGFMIRDRPRFPKLHHCICVFDIVYIVDENILYIVIGNSKADFMTSYLVNVHVRWDMLLVLQVYIEYMLILLYICFSIY